MYLTEAFTEIEVPEVTIPDVAETVSWLQKVLPVLWGYGKVLLVCLAVFLVGRRIIKVITRTLRHSFEKSKVDEGARRFITALVNTGLNVLLLFIIAGIMGVEASSIVAIVGSAGLTLGLALQGSLSNLAGGVLIMIRRPFVLGDYVVTPEGEGTVNDIDIFYTRLRTLDNKTIVIPNGTLSNSAITNVTGCRERMLDLLVSVSYDSDVKQVKDCLEQLLLTQEGFLREQGYKIFVAELGAHSVQMGLRFWVKTEHYWNVKWELLERIFRQFKEEGIEIPYEQLDVHLKDELEKGWVSHGTERD